MKKIIFLKEDTVDDYAKNYKQFRSYGKNKGAKIGTAIGGGITTGAGVTTGLNAAHLLTTASSISSLESLGLALVGVLNLYIAIPLLVIGPTALIISAIKRNKMKKIEKNLGKDTLRKMQLLNAEIKKDRELKEIHNRLVKELKSKQPEESKIVSIVNELKEKLNEKNVDIEKIYASEINEK